MEKAWKTTINGLIDRLFRYFIPNKYYSDQETLRQSKISISFYLFNFVSFAIFSLNGILLGVNELFYATLLTGFICLLLAFLYKKEVAHQTCALLFAINGTLYISYMIYAAGGFNSTTTFSLILIPVYNVLLTNSIKSGIKWFLIVTCIFIAFYFIQSSVVALEPIINQRHNEIYFLITVVGFFLNIFILVLIFEYEKNRAISSLILTNENLIKTQNQLIQTEKLASLGELTAGIAHEIQNPLNFVNNFSELSIELVKELEEELQNGISEKELILELTQDLISNQEKINHHGKRASDIVKGMLEHSRNSSGKKELTNINELCDEYFRLSYHGLRAKNKSFNATMETQFETSLPQINIVAQDIGRVILNLINNAFYAVNEKKNSQGSEYKPIVTLKTRKLNSSELQIIIKDNGLGIPAAIQDKIFQPFFTTKPTGQGTGLGLSLSYDIIKSHGGDMKIESTEGEGCTFLINLPIN